MKSQTETDIEMCGHELTVYHEVGKPPLAEVDGSADAARLDYLSKHFESGRNLDCYLSTGGYRYKLADKYDHSVPYQKTLRDAIDASRQNDRTDPRRSEPRVATRKESNEQRL